MGQVEGMRLGLELSGKDSHEASLQMKLFPGLNLLLAVAGFPWAVLSLVI